MKSTFILLILLVTAMHTSYAQAPDPDTTARHFLIMASIGNLQEINAGKQATQKASRQDVQAFGKQMVTDHTSMEQQLMQLAQNSGYQLPQAATVMPVPDPHLIAASGDDFDRLYIHTMAPDHRTTVQMFQNYALTGKDPTVKAFAQTSLPKLKEHLAAIEALDKKYKDLSAH